MFTYILAMKRYFSSFLSIYPSSVIILRKINVSYFSLFLKMAGRSARYSS
jgi:hypothetical protein